MRGTPMRFALILAFISSVLFHSDLATAGSNADHGAQARPRKEHKRPAARSAPKRKASRKATKASRKVTAQAEAARKEVAVADDGEMEVEKHADAKPVAAGVMRGPAVAQTTDDEEPPRPPKKK